MRRSLVGDGDFAAGRDLAFGLAFDQRQHPAREQVDGAAVPGDDVRQVLDHAGQVGDLFFERLGIRHDGSFALFARAGQRPDACPLRSLGLDHAQPDPGTDR